MAHRHGRSRRQGQGGSPRQRQGRGNQPQGQHRGTRGDNRPYRPAMSRLDISKIDLKAISRKAMREHGFDTRFPATVITEVNALNEHIAEQPRPGVLDLRKLLWSSIDNIDSEDLDQIEYCEQGKNGEILVKVAIADVDSYVPKGSYSDRFACLNTTSVYPGIETYPMLPDRLSKNLSSLLPGKDHLAVVIEFAVLPTGGVRPGTIYRARVRNRAKLVYEELGAWLEGKGEMPVLVRSTPGLEAQIRLQDTASRLLGGYRVERGALELDTREARAVVKNEHIEDVVVVEVNRARHLIENFMVAANGTMSSFLEKAGMPIIQRVVRVPKYWGKIVDVAKARLAMSSARGTTCTPAWAA